VKDSIKNARLHIFNAIGGVYCSLGNYEEALASFYVGICCLDEKGEETDQWN
jgi:hypothetical protein